MKQDKKYLEGKQDKERFWQDSLRMWRDLGEEYSGQGSRESRYFIFEGG